MTVDLNQCFGPSSSFKKSMASAVEVVLPHITSNHMRASHTISFPAAARKGPVRLALMSRQISRAPQPPSSKNVVDSSWQVFQQNNHTQTQNNTGQRVESLLLTQSPLTKIIEGKMGKEMLAGSDKTAGSNSEESKLSERDTRLLLVICSELVNLLAKATSTVDPAAAAMLAYVRDDIRFENKSRIF